MKGIKCDKDGRIMLGNVLKSGNLSEKGSQDVTSDCVMAIAQHLCKTDSFKEAGAGGYKWEKEESGLNLALMIFDSNVYELTLKETKED